VRETAHQLILEFRVNDLHEHWLTEQR